MPDQAFMIDRTHRVDDRMSQPSKDAASLAHDICEADPGLLSDEGSSQSDTESLQTVVAHGLDLLEEMCEKEGRLPVINVRFDLEGEWERMCAINYGEDVQEQLADQPASPLILNGTSPIHGSGPIQPLESLDANDYSMNVDLHSSPPNSTKTPSTTSSDENRKFQLNAVDAYNADPVKDICKEVLHIASQQLRRIPGEHLFRFCCTAQQDKGVPTLWCRLGDKIACWDCYTSKNRVCIRWLGGDEYLMLPLAACFRRVEAEPWEKDYWIWDGVVRGKGI
jgi:hypothetical protein